MAKGEIIKIFNHDKILSEVTFLIQTGRGLKTVTLEVNDLAQVVKFKK